MVDVCEPSGALRSEPSATPAPHVPVLVRPLTFDDVDWLIDIGVRRYPNNYDPESTARWIREVVLRTPLFFGSWRTDNAFLIAVLTLTAWLPNDVECHVIVTASDFGHIWETMPLLRRSVEWAKYRKCKNWNFQSDTDNDITPLMRRLRAKEIPRFTIEF